MPFKSTKQRAFMYSQHPEIARKWAKEGKGYVKRKKKPSKRHYSMQAIEMVKNG